MWGIDVIACPTERAFRLNLMALRGSYGYLTHGRIIDLKELRCIKMKLEK